MFGRLSGPNAFWGLRFWSRFVILSFEKFGYIDGSSNIACTSVDLAVHSFSWSLDLEKTLQKKLLKRTLFSSSVLAVEFSWQISVGMGSSQRIKRRYLWIVLNCRDLEILSSYSMRSSLIFEATRSSRLLTLFRSAGDGSEFNLRCRDISFLMMQNVGDVTQIGRLLLWLVRMRIVARMISCSHSYLVSRSLSQLL